MNVGAWKEPVTFETDVLGQYRTITSATEAAHALANHWPVEEGKALQKAKEVCVAVLEGKKKPEVARKAFLKAAEEADVFIRA